MIHLPGIIAVKSILVIVPSASKDDSDEIV